MTQDKGILAFPGLVMGTSPPALPHQTHIQPSQHQCLAVDIQGLGKSFVLPLAT